MKLLKIPALACALTLALAACDGDGVGLDDVDIGEFEGSVSGEIRENLRGNASSGSSAPGYHDLIILTDPAEGAEIVLYHSDDEFFEGSTSIRNNIDLEYADGVVAQIEIDDRFFVATSGTVNIRDASRDHLDGTVRFRAVELDEFDDVINGSEVTVDVAFRTEHTGVVDFNRSPSFSVSRTKISR